MPTVNESTAITSARFKPIQSTPRQNEKRSVNGENPLGIQGGAALAAALRLSSSPTSEMNFTQRNCG